MTTGRETNLGLYNESSRKKGQFDDSNKNVIKLYTTGRNQNFAVTIIFLRCC